MLTSGTLVEQPRGCRFDIHELLFCTVLVPALIWLDSVLCPLHWWGREMDKKCSPLDGEEKYVRSMGQLEIADG